MKYKALVSFSGKITKVKGDEFNLEDKEIANDLIHAKFIEEINQETVHLDKKIQADPEKSDEEKEEIQVKPKKTVKDKKGTENED